MSAAKKVTLKNPDHESYKAKKIYRSVCEIIKRLDIAQNAKAGCRELFTPDLILLRDRLQEYCEKLMFSWPLEYGRKAEEVIWRKGFYDVIQLVKKHVKEVKLDGAIEKAFKTHLSSALGYYGRLLFKIQFNFDIKVDGCIDFVFISRRKDEANQSSKLDAKAIKTWAIHACFRSLVYMGDVARYQHEYDGASVAMAERYYYQALRLMPALGMPYNQLGTLSGTRAYGFHAAYYYIRCLVSPTPFDGTNNNLLKLFERNRKKLLELEASDDVVQNRLPHNFHHRHPRKNASSYARSKNNKKFLLRFIRLIDLFFTSPKECNDKNQVYELCQVVLDDFDRCLKARCSATSKRDRWASSCDDRNSFDDDAVFKVFVVCLATVHHLSKKGHELMAAAIAFSLAMFSHNLNFILVRLQPSLYHVDELEEEAQPQTKIKAKNERKPTTESGKDAKAATMEKGGPLGVHDRGGGEDGGCGGGGDDRRVRLEIEGRSGDDKNEDVERRGESVEEEKTENSKRKVAFSSRKRTKGSDNEDDDEDDEDTDKEFYGSDGDNLSSEVESEGALSDLDLLTSSDEGSGMESQPEDELEGESDGRPTRAPAYHKKATVTVSSGKDAKRLAAKEAKAGSSETAEPTTTIKERTKISAASGDGCKEVEPVVAVAEKSETLVTTSDGAKCTSESNPDDWKNDPGLDENSESWLSNAALFLGRALNARHSVEAGGSEASNVLGGNRDVPVPPGFEKSLEMLHVMEITEKLANFNIETDTDVNLSDGDETIGDPNSEVETNPKIIKMQREARRKELSWMLNGISGEMMLEPVKIFVDWMTVNPLLVDSCAKISSSLWYRLACLLNVLPSEKDLLDSIVCKRSRMLGRVLLRELKDETDPERRLFPLTEDVHLMEFQPLRAAHQRVDFDSEEFLNDKQEAIIRLCRIRASCRSLSTLQGLDFNYNQDSGAFQGPSVNPTTKVKADAPTESKATTTKPLSVLRVKNAAIILGRRSGELEDRGFPMHLVPDTESIYEGLKIMKKLVQNDRLRIVIPKVVLAFLDSIKSTSSMTLKALEWVEEEVCKRDKGRVRIQKPNETIASAQEAKRSGKEDYILSIIDCCLHLLSRPQGQKPPPSPDSAPLNSVCLLTWMTVDNPELSEEARNALEEAIRRGVKVKSVTEFFHQWQQLSRE